MTALRKSEAPLERTVLAVPAMHCAGCMSKIERGMAALPGVASARVNLSTRMVAIEHAASLDSHSLVMALADLGFEAQPRRDELAPRFSAARPLLAPLAVAGFAAMNVMLLSVSVWAGADACLRYCGGRVPTNSMNLLSSAMPSGVFGRCSISRGE